MQNKELQDFCLNQCKEYFSYIEKSTLNHGKNLDRVSYIKYQRNSSPKLYEIKLEKPIYDFEKTYFKNTQTNEYYFNKKDILIREYDHKNRLLYVQVINDDIIFDKIKTDEFFVVSDLLFLIKNLIIWYEKNAHTISFENDNFNKMPYDLNNLAGLILNDKQKESVVAIFTHKYSYIWGPPGTGKTKAVLSCAAINYMQADKKILIVSPTNIALEQILYGILENTNKLNIPNDKFLRIGIPSKEFIDSYPQVCETKVSESEIKRIENEVHIISRVLRYREGKEISLDLEDLDLVFNEIISNKRLINALEEKLKDLKPLINLRSQVLKSYHYANKCKIIKDAIFKRKAYSCVIYNEEEIEKGDLSKVIDLDALRIEIKNYNTQITFLFEDNINLLETIKSYTKSEKIHKELFLNLKSDNLLESQKLLLQKITKLKEWAKNYKNDLLKDTKNDALIDEALDDNHKSFDIKVLLAKRSSLKQEKQLLLEQETRSRIKDSRVIAMTIDAYIQYTITNTIDVDHIFCDEAAYMSNIKALSLFTSPSPITFLGDHKQLPPISEVSKDDSALMEKTFLFAQSAIHFESIFLEDAKELYTSFVNDLNPKYQITAQVNLNTTHRFGGNLAYVLDKFIYKFGFESASKNETKIISINSNSYEYPAYERSSINEALIIKDLVKEYDLNSFAILSPYKKQVKLLKETLGKHYSQNIMTIHKSQGKEWPIVIFSVVADSHTGKRAMFFTNTLNVKYSSANLINTLVSRAVKKLIIVANYDFWLKDIENQLISQLIHISEKQ